MWFNVTLGILGRAVFPDLSTPDEIFPQLIDRFLTPGLLGIVIAGLLAGGISTFDSIGSALAAVFTRDLYARFVVTNASDGHYLWVSRTATVLVIALGFVYVPFLEIGMVEFYLQVIGVAVIPLLTVYLMGVLTRVHRSSGTIGLVVGMLYGLSRFAGQWPDVELPIWWENKWCGYLWSIGFTAGAMVITSVVKGWAHDEEIGGLVVEIHKRRRTEGKATHLRRIDGMQESWLEKSHDEISNIREQSIATPSGKLRWYKRTVIWASLMMAILSILNLVVFW